MLKIIIQKLSAKIDVFRKNIYASKSVKSHKHVSSEKPPYLLTIWNTDQICKLLNCVKTVNLKK